MRKTFLSKKILIIGASGVIGDQLFNSLSLAGVRVNGTSKKMKGKKDEFFPLDFFNLELIRKFPWRKYDIIINCAGSINYQDTLGAVQENINVNALAPLYILSQLHKDQIYFHCSTHVVLSPPSEQNSYSLSKLLFENCIDLAKDIKAKVIILRLPGIFHENRKSGIIHLIKKHYQEKEPLVINWNTSMWHVMYLPRAIEIILSLLKNNCVEKIVSIGYQTETTVEKVLEMAEKTFGFALPVDLKKSPAKHYIPDTRIQKKYIKIKALDFEQDLINYFKQ